MPTGPSRVGREQANPHRSGGHDRAICIADWKAPEASEDLKEVTHALVSFPR